MMGNTMKFSKSLLKTTFQTTLIIFGLTAIGSTAIADNHKQHSREWYNEQWKKKQQNKNNYKKQKQVKKHYKNNHYQPQKKSKHVVVQKHGVVQKRNVTSGCRSGYKLYIHQRSHIKKCLQRGGNDWRLYGNYQHNKVVAPKRVVKTKKIFHSQGANKRCSNGYRLFHHQRQGKYECFKGPRKGWVGVKVIIK